MPDTRTAGENILPRLEGGFIGHEKDSADDAFGQCVVMIPQIPESDLKE